VKLPLDLVVPFSQLSASIESMKFRILNIIFCESFGISRSVHFNEYVAIVLEKYVLSLIEIRLVVFI
jgi:hypothetical protein